MAKMDMNRKIKTNRTKVSVLDREKCVCCGSILEEKLRFDNFPVFSGARTKEQSDFYADLTWAECVNCKMPQLGTIVPEKYVYKYTHNPGTVGQTWINHHNEFARFLINRGNGSTLEIGGGHGRLSEICIAAGFRDWIMFEPNPGNTINPAVKIRKEFFSEKTKPSEKFDLLVHSHFFEHLLDPNAFLKIAYEVLNEDGHMIFSIPNMEIQRSRGDLSLLTFEHTYFLNSHYLVNILNNNGFSIVETHNFGPGHSLFVSAKKVASQQTNEKFNSDAKSTEVGLQDEVDLRIIKAHSINLEIIRYSEMNLPIICFGAHVYSQFLIRFGLDESLVNCILDNDPSKEGQILSGTNLIVQTPKLDTVPEGAVIITSHMGAYKNEIEEGLRMVRPNIILI